MARVSFTLRRSVIDRGSYVRYDSDVYNAAASAGNAASAGTWVADDPVGTRDIDSSLRSDGYQLPPVEFVESFLEAYPVAYGVSQIKWGAPLVTIGPAPAPSQTVLVYSPYGPAATISSGIILSEGSAEFDYLHNGLSGGQWAYYTLFIRYQSSGGDDYYEPAATVEILIPENYGSTTLLWERIPQYYRQQDVAIGEYVDPTSDYAITELGALPAGNVVGPLFKFISIFGFEMDTTRTLIDYLMISRDPAIANTESLNALALSMGVTLSSDIINSTRIRNVLDDIGYLRRSKGTVAGVAAYGRALSNSEIEIDTVNREITFYSQRVNYVTDPVDATGLITSRPAHIAEGQRPLFNQGTYDPTTYVDGDENTYPLAIDNYLPGMYWTSASATTFKSIPVGVGDYIVAYTDSNGDIDFGVSGYTFGATNYSAYTSAYSTTGTQYSATGTGASVGVTHVMLKISDPVPVKLNDTVYFSVHSAIGTDALVWGRLVDESGNIIGVSSGKTRAGDSPAVGIPVTDNLSTTEEWTLGFVEFLIDLSSVNVYALARLLIERNHLGDYFDGTSRRGGWIVDASGSTVSDYRWAAFRGSGTNSGNPYDSVSIYTEEYQRTRALLTSFFASSLPITVADSYTVVATNAVPGQDAIDTYLTP